MEGEGGLTVTHFHILRDHQPKKRGPKPKPRPMAPCACGCGETIFAKTTDHKPRKFKFGHQARQQSARTWTDDRVKFLRANWRTMSGGVIAEHLGMTRQAVIAKANRLGLETPDPLLKENRFHKPASSGMRKGTKRAPALAVDNTAPNTQTRVVSAVPPKRKRLRVMDVNLEPSRNLLVGDLSRSTCAFPTSTEKGNTHSGLLHKFCGAPCVEGRSMCAGHLSIAYLPQGEQGIRDMEREAA